MVDVLCDSDLEICVLRRAVVVVCQINVYYNKLVNAELALLGISLCSRMLTNLKHSYTALVTFSFQCSVKLRLLGCDVIFNN